MINAGMGMGQTLAAQSLELANSGRGWGERLHRGGGLELKLEGSVAVCWGAGWGGIKLHSWSKEGPWGGLGGTNEPGTRGHSGWAGGEGRHGLSYRQVGI